MESKSAIATLLIVLNLAGLRYISADGYNTIIHEDLRLEVSDFELPWSEAVAACESNNGSLLSVNSRDKDRTIFSLFMTEGSPGQLPGNNTWISATETREGVWQWDTLKEPLYYSRWYIGQPDDTENLNCVYMATQGMLYWRDANCSAPMFFICESIVVKDDTTTTAAATTTTKGAASRPMTHNTILLGFITTVLIFIKSSI